jgi:hypothetical protein
MKLFQEFTVWADGGSNHSYYMDDAMDKMYAYIPVGSDQVVKFKRPIKIDTRGRKFKQIIDTHNFTIDEPSTAKRWEVTGSKGDVYVVSLENGVYNCSCSGFKFRGQCRHVDTFIKK